MISFHLNVSIILFLFFLQKFGILGYVFLKMSLHNIIFISGRLTYFLVAEYRIYQWQIIIFINCRISYLLVAEYRIYQWQNIVFINGRLSYLLVAEYRIYQWQINSNSIENQYYNMFEKLSFQLSFCRSLPGIFKKRGEKDKKSPTAARKQESKSKDHRKSLEDIVDGGKLLVKCFYQDKTCSNVSRNNLAWYAGPISRNMGQGNH